MNIKSDVIELLESEALRINNKAFIDLDPVQFPRRFDSIRDIEIVAFLSAIVAWGNRKMICRNIERMLELMDYQPYNFLMDRAYESMNPDMNLHRTFFARHFQYFMRGLHEIYLHHNSLNDFALSHRVGETENPSWELVRNMQQVMSKVNDGNTCSQCLPTNLDKTALKRINMALRWLVRDDGIVDMGVWNSIDKSKLYIPLDVHVGNTARSLGLISRKANDKITVIQLTDVLRTLRPNDPVYYDYALFGIGVGI